MGCEYEQYETFCKTEFADLKTAINKLDNSIRGNGKPGLLVRIDRLEQAEEVRSKLLWLIAASVVTSTVSLIASLILMFVKG